MPNFAVSTKNQYKLNELYESLKANKDNPDKFADSIRTFFAGIRDISSLVEPVLAEFVSRVKIVKEANGQIDPRVTVFEHIKGNNELTALYHVFMHSSRSLAVPKQITNTNYCSLVPFFLYGFKRYRDIPYSAWSINDLNLIVEKHLYEAMMFDVDALIEAKLDCSDINDPRVKDDILAERQLALEIKSKPGTYRNPETTYSIYPARGSFLLQMPILARIMLCQIWCAHPTNRNKYMVLDPNDWDNVPEPLISTKPLLDELPWV